LTGITLGSLSADSRRLLLPSTTDVGLPGFESHAAKPFGALEIIDHPLLGEDQRPLPFKPGGKRVVRFVVRLPDGTLALDD